MDISKWGFQNRNLVYFLVAVLLAGGALACYQMSKLEDPEIKVKLAMVAMVDPTFFMKNMLQWVDLRVAMAAVAVVLFLLAKKV